MAENIESDGFDTAKLLGLTVQEALPLVQPLGYTIRVTRKDGRYLIGTKDCHQDRVNVVIQDGVIVNVVSVG